MEEWRFGYDSIMEEKGGLSMKEIQPLLDSLEDELYAKYPSTEEWEPIEDWNKVIEMRSGSDKWKLFLCIDKNGCFTFAKQEVLK